MKKYTYYSEIRNILANFVNAFDSVIIKRFDENNDPQQDIQVNYYYAPKNRVLHDIVNKAGTIKLPVIACNITSVARDVNRVFNKIEGPYYTLSKTSSGYEKLLQPVPVNIAIQMNIVTRFQRDLDQILSNFIPYNDPYIVLSWKMPYTGLEIRSHVIWDGNISIQEPTDIAATDLYRQLASTNFTIEGWLFKKPEDPIGKIYKIDTSFTAVKDIVDSYAIMHSLEDETNTDTFIISARPQLTMCDPYLTIPCVTGTEFSLYGKMFDYVTNIYAEDDTGVFNNETTFNPASGNAKISAMYPAFTGIEITNWVKHSDNYITFYLPRAVSAGFVDIIAFDEAGYGRLTVDAVRETFNPYPSTMPEYSTYIPYQHPSVSGINILPAYYNC